MEHHLGYSRSLHAQQFTRLRFARRGGTRRGPRDSRYSKPFEKSSRDLVFASASEDFLDPFLTHLDLLALLRIILILTVTELLVDNAPVPAGGPFIVLLPAGGPFTFMPLVDNASVTAGGPFIFVLNFVRRHS